MEQQVVEIDPTNHTEAIKTEGYDKVTYCVHCGEELNRESTGFTYLAGTFGNPESLGDWPSPFVSIDECWNNEQKDAISMHYVNNMTETTVASLESLKESAATGRYIFEICKTF